MRIFYLFDAKFSEEDLEHGDGTGSVLPESLGHLVIRLFFRECQQIISEKLSKFGAYNVPPTFLFCLATAPALRAKKKSRKVISFL
jgi:hypothetical protein